MILVLMIDILQEISILSDALQPREQSIVTADKLNEPNLLFGI
jgi:hypothetical protein